MAIEIMEDGWIRDAFEIGNPPLVFKDALIMRSEEYESLTPEEIQARKQARYDNWYAIITAPPEPAIDQVDPSTGQVV